jgi:hypothetical protein
MDRASAQFHAQLIKNAQILFKFSLGISATRPELGYLQSFASYRHTANGDELQLTREDEFAAASFLEHVATYVLAVQIDTVLETAYPDRFQSTDQIVRSTSAIARLIRNAFAHNPFAPKWIIDRKFLNKEFVVPDVTSLDTTGLNGQYVDRAHYGGPLALLKLSEFVRGKLERDSATLVIHP